MRKFVLIGGEQKIEKGRNEGERKQAENNTQEIRNNVQHAESPVTGNIRKYSEKLAHGKQR